MNRRGRRCVSMVKGRHRFVFWFHVGQERELLARFVELADDPESEFDWLDAAVLTFQIGRPTRAELDPVV